LYNLQEMNTIKKHHIFILFLGIQTLLVVISVGFPFFWDAAYHAQVALNIYENEFNTIFPDNYSDAGHPTLFNLYLALGWKVLGKNLVVSHLLQLPFVWGYVYFVYKLIEKYVSPKHHWIAVMLLCAESTLTAQVMSLNPDMAMLCGFFMALYGIDRQKPAYIIAGTVLLSLLSIRGWIMGIALCGIDFVNGGLDIKQWKKYIQRYILFALLIAIWLFAHHYYTGRWFASETYKSEFSWKIIPKNIIIFIFRLIDTGRIALWILVLWFIFKMRKNILILFNKTYFLSLSASITLAVFFILFVPLTNPIGHRYFMTVYVLLIILLVQTFFSHKSKTIIFILTGICFISGHFWIYPVPFANGWDASLAHIPYFNLKDEVLQQAEKQNIPYSQIHTFPPLHKSDYITRLSTKKAENLPLLNGQNFTDAPYILYSNISNHFNKREIQLLKSHYTSVYTQKRGFIVCTLYQKKQLRI